MRGYIAQALQRLLALGIPLLVVFGVRALSDESFQSVYFELLTDAVLLVAMFKLGVDVYIPGSNKLDRKVEVSISWKKMWVTTSALLAIAAIVLVVFDGLWMMPLAVLVALNGLLLAEIFRLNGDYLYFYLLKSPIIYVVVLLLCLLNVSLVSIEVPLDIILVISVYLISVLVVIYAINKLAVSRHDFNYSEVIFGTALSFFIVAYSWKEAAISRYIFGGEYIAPIVTYTRLAIVVTFPFMLRNARIPNLMRTKYENTDSLNSINSISTEGRGVNLIWAILSSLSIVFFAVVFEPQYSIAVTLLMLSTIVFVAIGNVIACLVYLREYKYLLFSLGGSLVMYLLLSIGVSTIGLDKFIVISGSALIAQCFLALCLKYSVNKLHANKFSTSTL